MEHIVKRCLTHFSVSDVEDVKKDLCRIRLYAEEMRHPFLLQYLYIVYVISSYLDYYELLKVKDNSCISSYLFFPDWSADIRISNVNNWKTVNLHVEKDSTVVMILKRVENKNEKLKMESMCFKMDDQGWAIKVHDFFRTQFANARFSFYVGEEKEAFYREIMSSQDALMEYLFGSFLEGVILDDDEDY